jgi:hypothetical protein
MIGLELARPCTFPYMPYNILLSLKSFFPFKKLNPSIKTVTATTAIAPTFVSLDIFTFVKIYINNTFDSFKE